MNIWLISPYHTGSHQAWAEGYARHSRHAITLLTMAGRFWKWRMQGGAIELAAQASRLLTAGNVPDAILATDMLNLPAWLGLLRKQLPAHTALVLYMHENQLTYPWRPGEGRDLTYAMINWLSQLAADAVIFNSRYHHDVWFAELPSLLKHYPDYNALRLVEPVRARSAVLPVGLEAGALSETPSNRQPSAPPLILWNQRWEHDKRPDRFFELLYQLRAAGVAFRLAVAGENFRQIPAEFEDARTRLADVIVHWGYLPTRADYLHLLQQTDLIISTTEHEFFGISVLEALAAGAFPLLPDRLSYPELLPATLHARCLYASEAELLAKTSAWLRAPQPAPPALRTEIVAHFDWRTVAAAYDDFLAQMVQLR
jgi:glycosyltransferase involved in cell wall biosynthesis